MYPPATALADHVRTARALAKLNQAEVLSVADTGSMQPVLSAQDLLVVAKVDFGELRAGDVVVFHRRAHWSQGQFLEKGWVGHRIIEIRNGYVITKGDNPEARIDDDRPGANRIRGRVIYVVNGRSDKIRDMLASTQGERVTFEQIALRSDAMME
jgi:signal peptidase I